MKQKELEKLDSEIQVNQAKVMQLEASAMKDSIAAENEASGIEHERQMEKQTAQAKGNQSLEVTKGLLKAKKEGESDPDIEAAIGFNELSKMLDQPRETTPNDIGSSTFDPQRDPALNTRLQL